MTHPSQWKTIIRSLLVVLFLLGAAAVQAAPYLLVLGIAQDGGYPHMGCKKKCCKTAWEQVSKRRSVVSLALVDPAAKKWWLFEASPDIKEQLHYFAQLTNGAYKYLPDGIFITHAHIGHYTGLMELGREVMNTRHIPVYVLPRLKKYLEDNGPWSQLVQLGNINLVELHTDVSLDIAKGISVAAFTVPHRDEFSETAGFRIGAAGRKYLFIPDINKWATWDKDIVTEVQHCDIALLDATFYSTGELGKINIAEVPHPFVTETMQLFAHANAATKGKIHFIHFNHTNPLLWDAGTRARVLRSGYHLAGQGEKL